MKQRSARAPLPRKDVVLEFSLPIERDVIEEKVRQRAYELFQQRGCEDGHAMEDWLQAEAEILKERVPAA